MSRCEQEMCDRWMGDHLCPCAVEAGDPDAIEAMADWMGFDPWDSDDWEPWT